MYVDFEAFDSLEILDLSWNGFIGNLPHSLRALSSLKSLSLSSNYHTGSLPTQGKYFIKILCKDVFLCEEEKLCMTELSGQRWHRQTWHVQIEQPHGIGTHYYVVS